MEPELDALVVGGGPAGLAAALWLGRLRCRTLLADRGEPRNRWVDASFGYLGFDGQPPDALLEAGRKDLSRYAEVQQVTTGVRMLHRDGACFVAELDEGRVRAASVVLATGVVDAVPPLEGLREHYGRQVFVCPMCDGYEVREQRVAVLGAGGPAGAFAEELLRWAAHVTVVPLAEEAPTDEMPRAVTLADAPGRAVHGADGDAVVLELLDGRRVDCDAIFLRSETTGVTELGAHLGCDLDDDGLFVVDGDGRTSVTGVYAAGDCTPGPQLVQLAAAEGARAGLQCAQEVAARR